MSRIKLAHFYFGGLKLSYLRAMGIETFKKQNPTWDVVLHVPKVLSKSRKTWKTLEHEKPYAGKDYMHLITCLIREFDFEDIGFYNHVPETFKSDLLQWYMLTTLGGLWLDTDIIFHKPVPDIEYPLVVLSREAARGTIYYIAYMYTDTGHPFVYRMYTEAFKDYDPLNYQSIGNSLISKYYKSSVDFLREYPDAMLHDPSIILPVTQMKDINKIFGGGDQVNYQNSIGLHWFGGSPAASGWETSLTPDNIDLYDIPICRLLQKCV